MNIHTYALRIAILGLILAGSSLAQRTYTIAEIPLPENSKLVWGRFAMACVHHWAHSCPSACHCPCNVGH